MRKKQFIMVLVFSVSIVPWKQVWPQGRGERYQEPPHHRKIVSEDASRKRMEEIQTTLQKTNEAFLKAQLLLKVKGMADDNYLTLVDRYMEAVSLEPSCEAEAEVDGDHYDLSVSDSDLNYALYACYTETYGGGTGVCSDQADLCQQAIKSQQDLDACGAQWCACVFEVEVKTLECALNVYQEYLLKQHPIKKIKVD